MFFATILNDGTTRIVSHNNVGTGTGDNASFEPSVSTDGRFIAFTSYSSDLIADTDINDTTDVFLYDGQDNNIKLISQGNYGRSGNDFSSSPIISTDGRFVVFSSLATDLTPVVDDNGALDVFLYDRILALIN